MIPKISARRIPSIGAFTILAFLIVASTGFTVLSRFERMDAKTSELEQRIAELKGLAHPSLRLRNGRFHVRTSNDQFGTNRTGFVINPRVEGIQVFTNSVWKEPGRIVAVWITDWPPRDEIAKFEVFSAVNEGQYPSEFHVLAKPKNGQKISMDFTVTTICE